MNACLAPSGFIEGSSVPVSSAAQPREPRWSPSGIVASGTGGEHDRWPIGVADEPPRFAPDGFIERMGMADLGWNRRPAMGTRRAKETVAFRPNGAALSSQLRPLAAFLVARA